MSARDRLTDASSAESDKYKELLVNPTVLCLLSQRANIDCGGLSYVVIRYGSFYPLVLPVADTDTSPLRSSRGVGLTEAVDQVRRIVAHIHSEKHE